MIIKKNKLILTILIPLFFFYSYFLLNYYTLGDQRNYIKFYEAAANISLKDIFFLASSYIGSNEPISIYTLWSGAKLGIDKNIYISFFNLILLFGIYLLLIKYNSPWYVIILILTNFYLIILMTGAERLKFSYIILIYGLLLKNKKKIFLILLSPLAHYQAYIILIALAFEKLILKSTKVFSHLKYKKIGFLFLVLLIILAIVPFFYLQEKIIQKMWVYLVADRLGVNRQFSELIAVIIILFIGLLVSKKKSKVLLLILPMLVATYYLGGSRTNMISFSLVFYILLIENRLKHPYFLVILIYLSLKSAPFVKNIFLNNNGYDGFIFGI